FVASLWLVLLLIGVYLPLLTVDLVRPFVPPLPAEFDFLRDVSWPCRVLMVLWSFDAARRFGSPALSAIGCLSFLVLIGTVFLVAGAGLWQWLPAVWAATALASLPLVEFLHRRLVRLEAASRDAADRDAVDRGRAVEQPITCFAVGVLCLTGVASLIAFPWPLRVAGAIGLVGLIAFSLLRRQPAIRVPALIVANWQILSLTVLVCAPYLQTLAGLTPAHLLVVCLPVAFVAAGSLLAWQILSKPSSSGTANVALVHRLGRRAGVPLYPRCALPST